MQPFPGEIMEVHHVRGGRSAGLQDRQRSQCCELAMRYKRTRSAEHLTAPLTEGVS